MPQTSTYGTESAANKAIGGIPTIHYFDFQSRGRGQVVRLLLIDAGAAFKDIRYSFEEWPEHKRSGKVAELNPTGSIPVVEMPDGRILTQSYAIIRHWARMLGAYDGRLRMRNTGLMLFVTSQSTVRNLPSFQWPLKRDILTDDTQGEHFSSPHSSLIIRKKITPSTSKVTERNTSMRSKHI